MIWHSSDIKSVLDELSVDENNGLPNGVAYERLEKYGKNQLTDVKPIGFFRRFLSQLNNKSVYIMAIISILCFVVSLIYDQGLFYSSFLIIGIVILNSALTAYNLTVCDRAVQYNRASSVPTCTVIREGIERIIPSNELVIGDIIILKQGDYVCADARLVETNSFRCNELALTGDMIPVEKDSTAILEDIVPIAGRKNMVYSGCNVIHGSAKAVVVETGKNTEIAKNTVNDSPVSGVISGIEEKLNSVFRTINISVIIICTVVFLIGIIIGFSSTEPFASLTVKSLLNAFALGICAIPESLPYITVIVTALGTGSLIREGIIIKNTAALESLSGVTVLCADKTGVFTSNDMFVKCIYNGEALESTDNQSLNKKSSVVLRLATACSMLEDDVTESAIESACLKFSNMDKTDIDNAYPRLTSIPFDGERKMMTSINMIEGKPVAIIKGAPEAVIKRCVGIDAESINNICTELANKSLRLICIAIKSLDEIPANPNSEEIEHDLKFAGVICLEDPLRTESPYSIDYCRRAGIKVVMITGDNLSTATSLAKGLGIISDDSEALNGDDLENIDDDVLKSTIGNYSVFARISPAQKLRIVETFKSIGETVAVTGNGLDDADVLSVANVGIAIGANGNDVARGNAGAIIKKRDFSSIVNIFKECYGLINNIRNTVHYLIGCNLSEVLFFILGLIIFKMPPLLAVQLLWINLITDAAPAVSVTVNHYGSDNAVLSYKFNKSRVFNLKSTVNMLICSVVMTVCAIIAFSIGNIYGVSTAYTMAFATIILSQIFHALNFASDGSIINIGFKRNEFMIISTVITVLITFILCLTPAGFVFGLKALSVKQLLISMGLSLLIIPTSEIIKFVNSKTKSSK